MVVDSALIGRIGDRESIWTPRHEKKDPPNENNDSRTPSLAAFLPHN